MDQQGGRLAVEPVVFGAWAIGGWWWGPSDDDAAVAAIRASVRAGAPAIDTAPVYGFGHSEAVVGRALKGCPGRVFTKVGLRWDTDEGAPFFETVDAAGAPVRVVRNLRPASVRLEAERSLRRLGVEVLDLVQAHWPDPSTPVEDTCGALAALVRDGLARAVGVSNFDVQLLERAEAALRAEGVPLASHQPRHSLLDRGIEAGPLPWCHARGIATLAYSPLGQGLLSGRVGPERVFPPGDERADHPWFTPNARQQVMNALGPAREIAAAKGCTVAQVCLAWSLRQPGLTAVIVGARDPAQAIENAGAAGVSLSDAEASAVEAPFRSVGLPED
jgi:aryl-alcohol dehydrogenase-like predicted oxidoreductase